MTGNVAFLLVLAPSVAGCGSDSRGGVETDRPAQWVDWPAQGEIEHDLAQAFRSDLAIVGSVVDCGVDATDGTRVWVERLITGDQPLEGKVVELSYACRRSQRIELGHAPALDLHVGSRAVFFSRWGEGRYYYEGGLLLTGELDEDRLVDFLEQAGSFESLSREAQLARIREWLGSGDAQRVYFGLYLLLDPRRADLTEALLQTILSQFRASTHPGLGGPALSILLRHLRDRRNHALYGVLIETLVHQLEDGDGERAARALVSLVVLRKDATGVEFDVDGVTPIETRDAHSCRVRGLEGGIPCKQWLLQGENRKVAGTNWRKWFSQGGHMESSASRANGEPRAVRGPTR